MKPPPSISFAPRRMIIYITAILLFVSAGCSFFSDLQSPNPTATVTPTETLTPSITPSNTPSITPSSTPTIEPTSTATNTPIPPRYETQAQENGSILALDQVCGYQFILPPGWKINIGEMNSVIANLRRDTDMFIDPNLTMILSTQPRKHASLELELYAHTADKLDPLDTVLEQRLTTNGYGATLGILKLKKNIPGMLHPTFTQTYTILFLCGDEMILLEFLEFMDTKGHILTSNELRSITAIQNSIQFE